MGVAAIKLEGRQRSPAYVKQITRVWRSALDACHNSFLNNAQHYQIKEEWLKTLHTLSEGRTTTLGAYHRSWQ